MHRRVIFWGLWIMVTAMLCSERAEAQIVVNTPVNNSQVCPLAEISGKIDGAAKTAAKDELWIIVHPKLVGDCWVQDPVSVAPDGTWSAYAHFGEPIAAHDGLPYEFKVMVLTTKPTVGKTVCWPASSWVSPVTTVTRRPTSQCP
jgi:hypothetical protein